MLEHKKMKKLQRNCSNGNAQKQKCPKIKTCKSKKKKLKREKFLKWYLTKNNTIQKWKNSKLKKKKLFLIIRKQ